MTTTINDKTIIHLFAELATYLDAHQHAGCRDSEVEYWIREVIYSIIKRDYPIVIPESFSVYPGYELVSDAIKSKLELIMQVCDAQARISQDVIDAAFEILELEY